MKKLFHNIELNESRKIKRRVKRDRGNMAFSQAIPQFSVSRGKINMGSTFNKDQLEKVRVTNNVKISRGIPNSSQIISNSSVLRQTVRNNAPNKSQQPLNQTTLELRLQSFIQKYNKKSTQDQKTDKQPKLTEKLISPKFETNKKSLDIQISRNQDDLLSQIEKEIKYYKDYIDEDLQKQKRLQSFKDQTNLLKTMEQ